MSAPPCAFDPWLLQANPGVFAAKTVDCFTRPGAVQLVHADAAVLAADVAAIRAMEVRREGEDREGGDGV